MPDWTQVGTPVHSKTTSTSPIGEPESSLTLASPSAVSRAMARFSSVSLPRLGGTTKPWCAKPFFTAKSTLPASMSAIRTVFAPFVFATAAARRPTAPAPKTRAVWPGFIRLRRYAWIATPRGSRRAPSSMLIPSGSLWHHFAGWLMRPCRVPWKCGKLFAELRKRISLQML